MALNYSSLKPEEAIPEPAKWNATHYHLNVDLPVPNGTLLTTPLQVQFRYLDNYFQVYTKALGDRTVQRPELWNNKSTPLPEMMYEVFTLAGHEKRLTKMEDQVAELKGIAASLQGVHQA